MSKNTLKTALVTGSAGFIGYHISKRLLDEGWRIVGLDCMSDYYDVSLKERRESILFQNASYRSVHEKVEAPNILMNLFKEEKPDVVIHLAAQAGVRYSIENPRAYLESNINGTFELLEAARAYPPKHMLLASTSSAYGASGKMPYQEVDKADYQVSFYAATKKSTENMAHSYSHLFNLPITMFRFFTVYGPWGRPDMAPLKFAAKIFDEKPIDIYNFGKMKRDFTYIDDITKSILSLIKIVPARLSDTEGRKSSGLSLSPVAPFRVVNIGNEAPRDLMDFIEILEREIGKAAIKNFKEMQDGDVMQTYASNAVLFGLTGYKPTTSLEAGLQQMIKWYRDYYHL